jgi:hypothetical protein
VCGEEKIVKAGESSKCGEKFTPDIADGKMDHRKHGHRAGLILCGQFAVVLRQLARVERSCLLTNDFVVLGEEASRGERHLEVSYEPASRFRHSQRSLTF